MIRTSVSAPFCFSPLVSAKACHMAYRRVGVYIVLLAGICWARAHTGDVSPDRALYLPIFSHFLIVNKTSLSPPPWEENFCLPPPIELLVIARAAPTHSPRATLHVQP